MEQLSNNGAVTLSIKNVRNYLFLPSSEQKGHQFGEITCKHVVKGLISCVKEGEQFVKKLVGRLVKDHILVLLLWLSCKNYFGFLINFVGFSTLLRQDCLFLLLV